MQTISTHIHIVHTRNIVYQRLNMMHNLDRFFYFIAMPAQSHPSEMTRLLLAPLLSGILCSFAFASPLVFLSSLFAFLSFGRGFLWPLVFFHAGVHHFESSFDTLGSVNPLANAFLGHNVRRLRLLLAQQPSFLVNAAHVIKTRTNKLQCKFTLSLHGENFCGGTRTSFTTSNIWNRFKGNK